ncbi:MAG: hypothetical protein HJJLKODD_02264 [Phycisphaerae bacterium]|nr:hypothetical protein [Phycisphaerae bacterium]
MNGYRCHMKKWWWIGFLLISGCTSSDFQDAATIGLFDFISGTITDSLTALLPVADALSGS